MQFSWLVGENRWLGRLVAAILALAGSGEAVGARRRGAGLRPRLLDCRRAGAGINYHCLRFALSVAWLIAADCQARNFLSQTTKG